MAAVTLGACQADSPFDIPPSPVTHVVVYTWPRYVQVGDTLRVNAEGFDGTGSAVFEEPHSASWRTHPAGIVALDPAPPQIRGMSSRYARGLAPGRAWVIGTLNTFSDSDSVVVVPRLARIELSPNAATIRVGDTLRLTARVVTVDGSDLEGAFLQWTISNLNGLGVGEQGSRTLDVIGRAPATATVTVSLARISQTATITVAARER